MNQITIGVTELARSEQFYAPLGPHLIVKTDHYLRFRCSAAGVVFDSSPVDTPWLWREAWLQRQQAHRLAIGIMTGHRASRRDWSRFPGWGRSPPLPMPRLRRRRR